VLLVEIQASTTTVTYSLEPLIQHAVVNDSFHTHSFDVEPGAGGFQRFDIQAHGLLLPRMVATEHSALDRGGS